MTALAPRRFPDRIVRRRQEPGTRNRFGEFVPGAVIEIELPASIQPLANEDLDVVEGSRLVERFKAYVPRPGALVAAFDDRQADAVLWGGREFVVEESRSWPRGHTRATLLREI